MEILYFEDYYEGLEFGARPYRVTKDELISFATKWDPQTFHTDEEAAKDSVFGGLSACSSHTFAIFCSMAQFMDTKSAALAGLGFDKLRMLAPVRPDDLLHFTSKVLEVRRSRSKPDRGIIRSEGTLTNDDGEAVFRGESTFLIACRDQPSA
jgi:acyl dehydratase